MPAILHELFVDAQRRIALQMREGCTDIAQMWIGLGRATDYRAALKAGLMRPLHDRITPRVSNWFLFTPAGISAYAAWSFEQWSAAHGEHWGRRNVA